MRRVALAVAFVGSVTMLSAQAPVDQPRFEVASVKRNASGALAQSSRIGSGSVTASNMRLRALIVAAYGVRPERIIGLPSWADQERFDISSRAPEGTPDGQLRPMLQRLLEDRFRLVVRTEMREQPVYGLVLARANGALGPNLIPSSECDATPVGAAAAPKTIGVGSPASVRSCTVFTGGNGRDAYIIGGARPIAALVEALQGPGLAGLIERPVIDRTGLTGTYDFDLRFAATSLTTASTEIANVPSVFTALDEQLGLKLEPARGPVKVLVVDSVEMPTAN
jgi:uncharacterized protein (TIGR03435 family)